MERTNLIEPEFVELCDVMNTSSRVGKLQLNVMSSYTHESLLIFLFISHNTI